MTTRVNRMNVKVLQPGQWTELDAGRFQVRGQKVLKLAIADRDSDSGKDIEPAINTEAYFLTPGYGDMPVITGDYFGLASRDLADGSPIYAMPQGDKPVTIIVLDYSV